MSAKNKLNTIHLKSAAVIAGLVGFAFQSFGAFIFAFVLIVGLMVHSGDLR